VFVDHIFIDKFREYSPIIDVNTTYIFLIGRDGIEEVTWYDKDDYNEECT